MQPLADNQEILLRIAAYAEQVGYDHTALSELVMLSGVSRTDVSKADPSEALAKIEKAASSADIANRSGLPAQLTHLYATGMTVDEVVAHFWPSMTLEALEMSFKPETIELAWERAGYEIINTGSSFWGATKTVGGIHFLISDYQQSALPNPALPLMVGGYDAESGEYLQFCEDVSSLEDAEGRLQKWAQNLLSQSLEETTSKRTDVTPFSHRLG